MDALLCLRGGLGPLLQGCSVYRKDDRLFQSVVFVSAFRFVSKFNLSSFTYSPISTAYFQL